jgi:hypothetical protein
MDNDHTPTSEPNPKPEPQPEAEQEYQGLLGRTRQEAVHYACGECGALFGSAVYCSVNVASDPELGEQLSKGELNTLTCTRCGAACVPNVPLVYHDPKARCFALLMPEAMRHEELRNRARVLESLMDDPSDIPDYVRHVDVVFGTSGLLKLLDETMEALTPVSAAEDELNHKRRMLEQREDELEQREGDLVAREEDLQAKQEDLVAQKARIEQAEQELAKGWTEVKREREVLQALALELQSRTPPPPPIPAEDQDEEEPPEEETEEFERSAAEDRPEDEVNAWRASDDHVRLLHHEGRTILLAKPEGELVERFAAAEPELLVQLTGTPSGPLVTLVAIPTGEKAPGADEVLWWTLDLTRSEHREALEGLADEFVVDLDVYDGESRLVKSREVRAPLAENVRYLLERGQALLEEVEAWDFAEAVDSYEALGEERLGRKQHNFSADSFHELPTPASTRLALGIVSYWSEPANQDYLILTKSFPLKLWRAIRERVVRRAMEYGLHLSSELSDFALKHHLAKGRKDLLKTCVANFAEVSLRIKPSDLDPTQELENWRLLLADCVKEGVQVEVEIEELAAAAAKRAGVVEDETAPGGDLSTLTEEALLPLLADRAQRRDAALELCDRGDPRMAEPVHRAVCNMNRGEVARVIPAMIPFGKDAARLFVKGLKHRKSFIRQGCALALGQMKAEEGITSLMEMLLAEPTNVWKEASRALGDMGTVSLGALVAGVRTADGEGRERISWALSQSALDHDCRVEVEAMAKGRDTRLARVAARAMELTEMVKANDDEVRGGKPIKEQTIVRSFTRQFFDSMSGEVSELSEDDILEQEEVLDESDILEEEVEVSDEDIIDGPGRS